MRAKTMWALFAWLTATVAFLVLPHLGVAQAPLGQTPPQVAPPVPPAAPAAGEAPLDPPLRLLAEARQAYQSVQDYSCLFVKRERVRGVLQPENVITMRVRARPFSVYLSWQAPRNLQGQEACYVAGKNNGMMRVHSNGLLGVAGWVSLDPNDPRALQTSRHTITEAGIGHLIERYVERWEVEKRLGRTQVRMADYEFNHRRCVRVEVTHPNSRPGEFYSYRGVIYFDKQTHLPIRSEAYDWPRPGGPPDGDLLECFSYVDLKVNVRLPANAFDY